MKVYLISIRDNISEQDLYGLIREISERKQIKVKKYRFVDDKKRSVYGELLLRHVISNKLGIEKNKLIIDLDDNGKPCLRGDLNLCFNISHSGDYVVCVIDKNPIGIDIEKIGSADFSVAKRVFNKDEYDRIFEDESQKNDMFFQYWTLKESYSKYTGKGLRLPFSSINFSVNDDSIIMKSNYDDEVYFFSKKYMGNYWISVCAKEKMIIDCVEQFTIKDII